MNDALLVLCGFFLGGGTTALVSWGLVKKIKRLHEEKVIHATDKGWYEGYFFAQSRLAKPKTRDKQGRFTVKPPLLPSLPTAKDIQTWHITTP
jgi:hypothetical protein